MNNINSSTYLIQEALWTIYVISHLFSSFSLWLFAQIKNTKQNRWKLIIIIYIFFHSWNIHQGFQHANFWFHKENLLYLFCFYDGKKPIGLFLNLDFHRPQTSDKSFYDFLINMVLIQGFLLFTAFHWLCSINNNNSDTLKIIFKWTSFSSTW